MIDSTMNTFGVWLLVGHILFFLVIAIVALNHTWSRLWARLRGQGK
jgi:hypothetical protein